MKNLKAMLLLLLVSLCCLNLNAQNDCVAYNNVFNPGELITYEGAYNWGPIWVKAGYATFSTKMSTIDSLQLLHIVGEGKTFKTYDWFFDVHDIYESFIDTSIMLPYQFLRNVDEDGYLINNKYTFHHEAQKAYVHYRKTNNKIKQQNEYIEIGNCTQDVLSAVFYVRNIDYDELEFNDEVPFKIMIDAKVYNVKIVYKGIEVKKVRRNNKFRCHKIQFDLIPGTIFAEEQTMTIWATADDNKVPVMVESPLRIGKAKFYMKNYEGLQYPMEALVD